MIAYILSYLLIYCFFDFYWQVLIVSFASIVFSPKDQRMRMFFAIIIAFSLYVLILQPQLYDGKDKYIINEDSYEITQVIRGYMASHSDLLSNTAKTSFDALIMGDMDYKSDLGRIVGEQGIVHLFVVSGFHFGLLFMMITFLLTRVLKLPYTLSLIIIAILSTLYFMIIQGGYGATRAYFMILLSILAFFMARDSDSENALFLITLFYLLLFPNSIHKLGFQLTFIATYILILTSKLSFIKNINSYFVKNIVISLFVSIAVSSFIFINGKELPVFAFLIIALSTPIVALLLIAMFIFSLVPISFTYLISIFVSFINFISEIYYGFLNYFSGIATYKWTMPFTFSLLINFTVLYIFFSRKMISYDWKKENLFFLYFICIILEIMV